MRKTKFKVWSLLLMFAASMCMLSCSDDDSQEDNNGGSSSYEYTEEDLAAYHVLDVTSSIDNLPENWQSMTFEPVAGVVLDPSTPYVRYIGVDDLAEAADFYSRMTQVDMTDGRTSDTFTSGDITLKYTAVNQSDLYATIDVNVKQMPHLTQIRLVPQSVIGLNAKTYDKYDVGDVIVDKDLCYWFCFKKAEGTNDSYWASFSLTPANYGYKGNCCYAKDLGSWSDDLVREFMSCILQLFGEEGDDDMKTLRNNYKFYGIPRLLLPKGCPEGQSSVFSTTDKIYLYKSFSTWYYTTEYFRYMNNDLSNYTTPEDKKYDVREDLYSTQFTANKKYIVARVKTGTKLEATKAQTTNREKFVSKLMNLKFGVRRETTSSFAYMGDVFVDNNGAKWLCIIPSNGTLNPSYFSYYISFDAKAINTAKTKVNDKDIVYTDLIPKLSMEQYPYILALLYGMQKFNAIKNDYDIIEQLGKTNHLGINLTCLFKQVKDVPAEGDIAYITTLPYNDESEAQYNNLLRCIVLENSNFKKKAFFYLDEYHYISKPKGDEKLIYNGNGMELHGMVSSADNDSYINLLDKYNYDGFTLKNLIQSDIFANAENATLIFGGYNSGSEELKNDNQSVDITNYLAKNMPTTYKRNNSKYSLYSDPICVFAVTCACEPENYTDKSIKTIDGKLLTRVTEENLRGYLANINHEGKLVNYWVGPSYRLGAVANTNSVNYDYAEEYSEKFEVY